MPDKPDMNRAYELFTAARLMSSADRDAFLEKECGEDAEIKTLVKQLLTESSETTTIDFQPTHNSSSNLVGTVIGRYKLLGEIGRGGMGTVYVAVRNDHTIGGRVAIKLITKGRDTDAAVNRFHVERRVLSGLQHPNIARFLDGGETEDGRAYFVMEYVEGMPIDKYCDANNLSVRQRVALFSKVCSAVQYAHTNLIVHRDLKPLNILVTSSGVPKLLDFGIAKILNPDMAGMDIATGLDQRLLTYEYASPEQVRGEPLTTRSDVYSLGVLLYELLCGKRPYEFKERIQNEMARVVSEYLPERPSTFLGKIKKEEGIESLTTLAEHRGTRPDPMLKQLSGEIDDIIMHALQKPAAKRYESAGKFGEDLDRYISGQPVEARKPANRQIYRLRKFYQRRKLPITVGAAAGFALFAGGVVSFVNWKNAQDAQLESAQSNAYAAILWDEVHGSGVDIYLPVDKRSEMYTTILSRFDEQIALHPNESDETKLRKIGVLLQLADTAFSRRGFSDEDTSEAKKILKRVSDELDQVESNHNAILNYRNALLRRYADLSKAEGNRQGAIDYFQELLVVLEQLRDTAGEESLILKYDRNLNSTRRGIAVLHAQLCQLDEAEQVLRACVQEANRIRISHERTDSLDRDWTVSMSSLMYRLLNRDQLDEAIQVGNDILVVRKRLFEKTSNARTARDYSTALLAVGDVYVAMNEHERAIEHYHRASDLLRPEIRKAGGVSPRLSPVLIMSLGACGTEQVITGDLFGAQSSKDELEEVLHDLISSKDQQSTDIGEFSSARASVHQLASMIAAAKADSVAAELEYDAAIEALAVGTDLYTALDQRTQLAVGLLRVLGDSHPELSSKIRSDAQRAIDRLEQMGAGCLIPTRVRNQIE